MSKKIKAKELVKIFELSNWELINNFELDGSDKNVYHMKRKVGFANTTTIHDDGEITKRRLPLYEKLNVISNKDDIIEIDDEIFAYIIPFKNINEEIKKLIYGTPENFLDIEQIIENLTSHNWTIEYNFMSDVYQIYVLNKQYTSEGKLQIILWCNDVYVNIDKFVIINDGLPIFIKTASELRDVNQIMQFIDITPQEFEQYTKDMRDK